MTIDRPALATWVANDETGWIERRPESERQHKVAVEPVSIVKALTDLRVACAFGYLCLNAASFGSFCRRSSRTSA